MLHRLDGSPMMKCPTVDGANYVDTSCLLVFRPAFRHLIAWALQSQDLAAEADQVIWQSLREAGVRMAFVDKPTVAYRTRHQVHYNQAREPFPAAPLSALTSMGTGINNEPEQPPARDQNRLGTFDVDLALPVPPGGGTHQPPITQPRRIRP